MSIGEKTAIAVRALTTMLCLVALVSALIALAGCDPTGEPVVPVDATLQPVPERT